MLEALDDRPAPMPLLRALVAGGAAAFAVGAWAGWHGWEVAGGATEGIPAHHLVGTGWAWLVAVPLLVAAVAPYTTRTLRWLVLAPVPAILAAVAALFVDLGSATEFPYVELIETRRAWLPVSLAGAGVAEFALVWAFLATPRERATRREVYALVAVTAAAVLAVAGLNLRQSAAGGETEASFRRAVERCVGREGTFAVWCWADGRCAYEVETPSGGTGGTFTEGDDPEEVVSCP